MSIFDKINHRRALKAGMKEGTDVSMMGEYVLDQSLI